MVTRQNWRRAAAGMITVAAALFLVSAPLGAADRPVASDATLVEAQALPKHPSLPQFEDGGFSGLYPANRPGAFWTMSDRGPNGDTFNVGAETRRPFLAPAFAPSIYQVDVDPNTQQVRILERLPLKLPGGAANPARAGLAGGVPSDRVTGFGNTAPNAAANVPVGDEVPTTDTNGDGTINAGDGPLGFDPYGVDIEGIAVDARDGTFWLVEEYRPSVLHVAADGTVLRRFTPAGQTNAALGPAWASVPLSDVLPSEYSRRRDNRGFEGVAISPDGRTLYAVMQNPLAVVCSGASEIPGESFQSAANRTASRIVALDISNPDAPSLTGDFVYTLDANAGGTPANSQLRISDLYWVGPGQLLVDERDDTVGTAPQGGTSTTSKRIYRADLAGATNVQSLPPDKRTCLDALRPTGVAARGVTAATKTLVLDLGSTSASGEYPSDKVEGIALLANGNIATLNDNDFGTGGPKPSRYLEYGTGKPASVRGYWSVARDGGVFAFGPDAGFHGSTGDRVLARPVVDLEGTSTAKGYWLAASDGGVFAFGDAAFHGSTGGRVLASPIVDMARTPTGRGYWLAAADGGVFAFGDAGFFGSKGGEPLNKPVVAFVPTRTGRGYHLIAEDGGVFTFGDATFVGSLGGTRLNGPIVGADALDTGTGYWLFARDGGVFSFGDAGFFGSAGSLRLDAPVVGGSGHATDRGYYLVGQDGGVFAYGPDARFFGSTAAVVLNQPVVALKAVGA